MVVYTGSGKRGNLLRDDFAPEGLRENGGEDWVALGFSAQMMEQVGAKCCHKAMPAILQFESCLVYRQLLYLCSIISEFT